MFKLNSSSQKRLRDVVLNETGQMAVFIALIFQVLFVLFAMVINIGLIVHDKINLQNSVDLAAYYAAAKQAEAMNMIGHINYQMRQDYKLLAWRYRVLGSFGVQAPTPHPAISDFRNGPLRDTAYTVAIDDEPSVCIGHPGWVESVRTSGQTENVCREKRLTIPELREVRYIPLSPSFNLSVVDQFRRARESISQGCQNVSPYNWGFATLMMARYRLAMSERKKQIQKIAAELSKEGDFKDISGASVREGALKTLEKNLTATNKAPESFNQQDESSFEFINGLSLGGCERADSLGFPAWLVDIPISPIIRYTELTARDGSCTATSKWYDNPPASNTLSLMDPNQQLRQLAGEPEGTDIRRSSRGFEKNPWCLAYVAIKAKTKPRKMFAPFGSPIEMEAKAIAEPFGGRIGPWYGKRWPARASQSDGSEMTDPLAVPRGQYDPNYARLYLPNYSRFPGDQLGLKSSLALGYLRDSIAAAFTSTTLTEKFSFVDYGEPMNVVQNGDVLAWNPDRNREGVSRRLELAAVAPDLFDLTYYSVDPKYFANYLTRATAANLFQGLAPVGDIGARNDAPEFQSVGITNQITNSQSHQDSGDAFYLVKDWKHLLTGWVQGGAVDYSVRSPAMIEKFGDCQKEPKATQPQVPGACIAGGRVGYSVRLVHKDYLAAEHELGGPGTGRDRIQNQLPSEF